MVTLINIRATLAALMLAPWLFFTSKNDFKRGLNAYRSGDYATAAELWHSLAEEGDPKAQHNLGVMYRKGHGVPQDYAKAVKWYRRAAKQGLAAALFNLGFMYENGHGETQDENEEAVTWYRRAAEQGRARAQFSLGTLYDFGCDFGDEFLLQDDDKAVIWYRRAAEQGYAPAQNGLGFMYDEGRGVPQNYVLAHMWFNLAAAQGEEMSLGSADGESGNRDIVARRMTSEQIARAQALAARCLASDYQDCGE